MASISTSLPATSASLPFIDSSGGVDGSLTDEAESLEAALLHASPASQPSEGDIDIDRFHVNDDEIDDEDDHELRCFDRGSSSPRAAIVFVADDAFARAVDELVGSDSPHLSSSASVASTTTTANSGGSSDVRREPAPRGYAAVRAHDQQKARERAELMEMIHASIANVPLALERIHVHASLRATALQQQQQETASSARTDTALLQWFYPPVSASMDDAIDEDAIDDSDTFSPSVLAAVAAVVDDDSDDSDADDSSGFGSDYEHDLAEAVNELCRSDDALVGALDKQLLLQATTLPRAIDRQHNTTSSPVSQTSPASGSPQSSVQYGASSPGTTNSLDDEPVAALWPRQPHQFAFTQEEEDDDESTTRNNDDEVYSELVSSMCDDDEEQDDDEEEEEDEEEGEDETAANVFEMDDDDDDDDDRRLDAFASVDSATAGLAAGASRGFRRAVPAMTRGDSSSMNDAIVADDDGDASDASEDDGDVTATREYEVLELRIIREKNKTGFEPRRDWQPRVGSVVGGRYRVELAIGEAVFSRTYKCLDMVTQTCVCLKIIKNSKEYFDQGVDEVRLLQYISRHCNVDAKHLVQLLDFFYFREHLIIVTELLRDNLYEFSKLLLARGVINYFSIARLKKVAIEVLEALQTLHALGVVHCDIKPENILISSFNACSVKVIDFGSACFVTDELTSYVQSRSYRAPEVILGLAYDHKIDVWSFGCVLAELFTGDVLFKNDSEQTLLARIIATIGPVPSNLLNEREDLHAQFAANELFCIDARGDGVLARALALPTLEQVVQTGDRLFLDFLRGLLRIDPARRLSATQALLHPWLASGVFSATTAVSSGLQRA